MSTGCSAGTKVRRRARIGPGTTTGRPPLRRGEQPVEPTTTARSAQRVGDDQQKIT
ncbi:MAG: hypothetical protein LBE67_08980 [Kocuria palustris]|nr:hypothetical protein [Kocuria palustris]